MTAHTLKNRLRMLFAVAAGAILALLAPASWPPTLRLVAGWDVLAIVYMGALLIAASRGSFHDRMKMGAAEADEGRWVILALICVGSFVSLVAIGTLMAGVKNLPGMRGYVHLALAIVTVVASWSMIHMVFALHYAHGYYGDSNRSDASYTRRGGLAFPGEDKEPFFSDFLYYSFVVGMTCQVSDVQVTVSAMRRLTLSHGILSFFFNTVILALSVNIAAGLVS